MIFLQEKSKFSHDKLIKKPKHKSTTRI